MRERNLTHSVAQIDRPRQKIEKKRAVAEREGKKELTESEQRLQAAMDAYQKALDRAKKNGTTSAAPQQ